MPVAFLINRLIIDRLSLERGKGGEREEAMEGYQVSRFVKMPTRTALR